MKKRSYNSPAIVEMVDLEMEESILASSAVVTEDTEVVSTGQEYQQIDMTGSIRMACSLPVALSLAETFRIPLASMSKVTSI